MRVLALLVMGLFLPYHCANTEQLVKMEEQLRVVQQNQEQHTAYLRSLEGELREGLTIALCRPEIRQLLEDVERECRRGADAATATCNTKRIHPAVVSADPEQRGNFLKFMTYLRHEVFYITPGKVTPTSVRRARLERLARQPLLKNTRFLVVAHPVVGEAGADVEAMRRAEGIAAILRQSQIPSERVLRWIYAFPVTINDLTYPMDRPIPGEPRDLTRSVWVFRADC